MFKLKIMVCTLLIVFIFAMPASALVIYDGNSSAEDTHADCVTLHGTYHDIGVSRFFGGSNTYGYSWIDPWNNSYYVYTFVMIGGDPFLRAYGTGYAQSDQFSGPGSEPVEEGHGKG